MNKSIVNLLNASLLPPLIRSGFEGAFPVVTRERGGEIQVIAIQTKVHTERNQFTVHLTVYRADQIKASQLRANQPIQCGPIRGGTLNPRALGSGDSYWFTMGVDNWMDSEAGIESQVKEIEHWFAVGEWTAVSQKRTGWLSRLKRNFLGG